MSTVDRTDLLRRLRAQLRGWEPSATAGPARLDAGCPGLERLLPAGGFRRGTLVEWLAAEPGSGAGLLALRLAERLRPPHQVLVALDREQAFFPPAAALLGIDLRALIVVQPADARDELWAATQALRCPAVAAVWGAPGAIDSQAFRRLQLAAEEGGAVGFLLRSDRVRGRPSWAEAQLLVTPLAAATGRRWRVELVRGRSGAAGGAVELELDPHSGALRETIAPSDAHPLLAPAELAVATAGRRAAGA